MLINNTLMTHFTCLICRAFVKINTLNNPTCFCLIELKSTLWYAFSEVNTSNVSRIFCELIYFYLRYSFVSYLQLPLITCIFKLWFEIVCFFVRELLFITKNQVQYLFFLLKNPTIFFPSRLLCTRRKFNMHVIIDASKEREVWSLKLCIETFWCLGLVRLRFHSIRFDFDLKYYGSVFFSERLIGVHFCLYLSGILWTQIWIGAPKRQECIAEHRTYQYTAQPSYREHVRNLACHTRIELPLILEENACTLRYILLEFPWVQTA